MLFTPYSFARPLLFSMDAEKAHDFTLRHLKKNYRRPIWQKLMGNPIPPLPTTLMGLSLNNPVGLAAGLDKNGEYIDALASFGFGFIEVGTVTPKAQPGNPKPRLFRIPQKECLINRMGFNNQGLATFLNNVQQSTFRQQGGILGLNLGKNATTPIDQANHDYLKGLEAVYPYADYVTINISSPNTQHLRDLQGEEALGQLLKALRDMRTVLADKYQRYVPIAIKIAPDLNQENVVAIANLLTQHKMDGVITTNTTLSRHAVQGLRHADESGGLSGPPVHELSLQIIASLRQTLGDGFAIIGVGGILSGKQALEKIQAGANAVQLYTGLIYKGPTLIKECVEALRTPTIA